MTPQHIRTRQETSRNEQRRLGTRLKLIRIERDITAKALAEKIGVSPSLISKVESGATNPSMDVLRRIVMELNVRMADLMDGQEPSEKRELAPEPAGHGRVAVVRVNERKRLRLPKRGLEYQLLTPDAQGAAEFVWVEMAPGEGGSEFLAHERGEESLLALQGSLTVYVGEGCHHLNPGDCITYDATLPHMYRNEGTVAAVYIYVVVPPTL